MSIKLKAGSIELEMAYIEWLRAQGYNPADGIDSFFSESGFVHGQLPMIHEGEREQLLDEARAHLRRRSADPQFTAQFPVVYRCEDENGRDLRYTVTLTISDEGAEWLGRIWEGREYLGEVTGTGSGPHVNYIDLARMHIESQIKRADTIVRRGA
ncbi:MAG: hypothetical protein ABIP44_07710 [Pseudoxanthomonas sp.]